MVDKGETFLLNWLNHQLIQNDNFLTQNATTLEIRIRKSFHVFFYSEALYVYSIESSYKAWDKSRDPGANSLKLEDKAR